MWINIVLGGVCLVSGVFLYRLLSRKIPKVLSIPDEVIIERFREDSKKIKLWVLPFKTLYEEVRYGDFFRLYFGRILYRLHIWLLRFDNRVLAGYNRLKETGIDNSEIEENESK